MTQTGRVAKQAGTLTQAERTARSDAAMFSAAIDLINEHGTRKMTLKEIGERAGYSRGLASYRFGSKDGLLSELLSRFNKRWKEHLAAHLGETQGLDAIRSGIRAQREFFDSEPRYLGAMYRIWYESLGSDSSVRGALAKQHRIYREDVSSWVLHGIEQGHISRTIDVDQFAARYCAFMFGTIYQWLVDAESLDLDALFADYQLHVETILRSGV
ncbi:MAG: TetR/AcrR family transcriptional regulator [Congregibacter sp.]